MASSSSSLSSFPIFASTSKSRLQSLYSDVSRQKYSNPTSYNAHIDWWHRAFEVLVSQGWQVDEPSTHKGKLNSDLRANKLVLNARRPLVEKLRFEGVGKPLGLGSTIAELRKSKHLISLSEFFGSTQSIYDPGWLPYRVASYVIGKPLWWALEQLDIVRSEEAYTEAEMWKKMEGDYVLVTLVERAADAVMEKRGVGMGPADDLYTFDSFQKEFAAHLIPDVVLSGLDIRVLVRFLERDKGVLVVDKDVIKFASVEENKAVTVVDRGILELKTAVGNLREQVDNVQRKIDETNTEISNALRQQRKSIALTRLRYKKQLDDLLSKRLGSLQQLESTLISVEAAAGNIEIMKSYEMSTSTLQNLLSHPSLQRDKVDETMDALAASNADAREIDDAIRLGGDMAAADAGMDDSELESELQALVEEAEKETKAEKEREVLDKFHGAIPPTPVDDSIVDVEGPALEPVAI
ncbi:Snf7-domain-containing protein [Hygrophoropsis aurantiaca]|uniref:Snf7-domain-containing protein n=1 Tax=Hygrophoropsis aurantiaca TaxID=72124 RepID=A0ACB8ALZ2_9AGAM|nr:Snf7-domain-containing protein [Hygrophoropsis aurantiaca]